MQPHRTFLDSLSGHRLYILGALGFLGALALFITGALHATKGIDAGEFCMVVGTIGAFIGGNELTGAVRDRANQPDTPDVVAEADTINVNTKPAE